MKFLADNMLGSLARWLRFLGFDTAYPDVLTDKDLKELARQENRVLLTRDKELSKAKDIAVVYIESIDLKEQLVQVVANYNLKITSAFSRCSLCNSLLDPVDKKEVEGKVPEKVFNLQDEYWECQKCKKFYWQGTHYQGIKKKLEELEGKASAL